MKPSLFGQYFYKDTLLHKLDPRLKVLSVVFLSVFLFFLDTYLSFMLTSVIIILLIIISKIRFIILARNLRPFLFFFAFILLMYFLFTPNKIEQGIMTVWRFSLLIIIASLLTFSTSVSQLVYAVEKLFAPLKLIMISPRNIAVMISTTIRFVPLLFQEADKIRDSQKSRCANLKKVKHIVGLIIPLLRKTFDRASNLSDAMESRCYRDNNYTHFRELKTSKRDYASALFLIATAGIILWIQVLG